MRLPFLFFKCSVLGTLCIANFATAYDNVTPTIIAAPVDRIFTPVGFDNNDNIEVILYGHFTNSCSKVGPASVKVDEATRKIFLSMQSWIYDSNRCLTEEMYLPFVQSISLGVLNKGKYSVQMADSSAVESQVLNIKEAKSSAPDEYLYAPIEDVQVNQIKGEKYQITVRGMFPNTSVAFYRIKEVRAFPVPGNIIIVLPIMEKCMREVCKQIAKNRNFIAQTNVVINSKKPTLIHVRSLGNQSVNRVLEGR